MKLTKEIQDSIPFQYANDVRSGKITTGKYIKLAVDRFFQWIDSAEKDGYHIDHNSGMHVIEFFEFFLKHTKGPLANEPVILSPYQQFTFYNIFAWKDENGNRRINHVYEKVARKNGKTAGLAGLGLYCQSFDDEEGAEIYAAATKEMQAKVCWEQAHDFVFKGIGLRKIGFKNTQREIRFEHRERNGNVRKGNFRFLGGDSKTQDGLNPSLAIIDEYHAHKDDGVKEVLESAMGARQNPITYVITTAGFNTTSVCKAAEDVYKDILDGHKIDNHTFIMIHDLDESDDWEDRDNWVKANPNLNVSVSMKYLKREYTKAINQPSKIPNFKTKHLNMWVDAAETRIEDHIWMKSDKKIKLANFIENGCAGALDMSSTTDLSSLGLVSNPDENGIIDILPLLFCPSDTIDKRSKEDKVPYRFWKDLKLKDYIDFEGTDFSEDNFWEKLPVLIATHGNQIDYATIEDYLQKLETIFLPKWWEYDRWSATQLVQNMTEKEIEMHPFSQTISHFSEPTKQFEKHAYAAEFRHGGHPILRWMMSGVQAYEDPNENIRYVKNRSTKRIDGIIMTIMALAGTITPEEDNNESKYNHEEFTL